MTLNYPGPESDGYYEINTGGSLEDANERLRRQRAAAAGPPKRAWWGHPKYIASLFLATLLIGIVAHHLLSTAANTPLAAAQTAAKDIHDKNYASLRAKLCTQDRSRVSVSDLTNFGNQALLFNRGIEGVKVDSIKPVTLTGEYASLPAQKIAGTLISTIGQGTSFSVTAVDQNGWRLCLSAGGFSLPALNVDIPVGGTITGVNP